MYRLNGFTLIELMVAITIGAILVTIGIPSFYSLIQRNTVTSTSNELLGALLYTRNEAVRQGGDVTFTPEDDGWLVTSDDVTHLDYAADNSNISIAGQPITYNPRGRARLADNQSIEVSYKGAVMSRVCLSITGRPFVKMIKDGACP